MARAGGRQRASGGSLLHEESDFFVRALARGLSVLVLFDVEHPEWSLHDISQRTGMSKTTAYRMVRTLEARGFLAYDHKTERYHLGQATIPMAYLAMSYVGFLRAARPFLEELARATGETVELTVGSAEGAVVVDEVATAHPFRLNRPTGRILQSLANSSFRTHVAFRTASEQQRIISSAEPSWSAGGDGELEAMMRRLAGERQEGIAYDLEEMDRGVCAASAPVMEPDGTLKAVVTVVAPVERFGPRERKRKVEALKRTAAAMTEHLGGRALGG